MSQSPDSLSVRSFTGTPRLWSPVIRIRSHNANDLIPLIRQRSVPLNSDQVLDEVVDIIHNEEKRRFRKGVIYICIMVGSWVISIQLANNLMKGGKYDHPMLVSGLNGVFFMPYGLAALFRVIRSYRRQPEVKDIDSEDGYGSIKSEASWDTPSYVLPYSQIALIGFETATIYYINGMLATTSLMYTTASNQTVLSTTSSLFTLILGVLARVERFSCEKLLAILASIFGILLIALAEVRGGKSEHSANGPLGDLLALIGAATYSMFLIVLKVKLGKGTDETHDMLVYLSMGLSSILLMVPVLTVADYTGLEHFNLPPNLEVAVTVLSVGILNALSDYAASRSTMLMSPLITSLSLSTAIPISMLCDSFFYGSINTSVYYYIGIVLIFSSFVFTSMADQQDAMDTAVNDAVSEAVVRDPALSPVLTHTMSRRSAPAFFTNDEIPALDIEDDDSPATDEAEAQLVVTGGDNGHYFIRGITT